MDTLKVRDTSDVEQAVRAAISTDQPLEIIGHGAKRQIGHPMATNAVLDLSALNKVTSYEPNELIITVEAGAPLADVLSLIDSKNQHFAFEPMNPAALLGGTDGGTIGGMLGAGLAGPRRIKDGGARDHLLGVHAVSGFGDSFKAGGRVVKNVTGYDLCKVIAGSWGTLAVVTEATLKVMPRPETGRTLVLRGLDEMAAVQAMSAALGSPFDVSGASHVAASPLHDASALGDVGAGEQPITLLRLEGIAESVVHRAASLATRLESFGPAETIGEDLSARVWAAIRDVVPFAASGTAGDWPVWRIVCPPASGGQLGRQLADETRGELIYDWGGGLIWLAVPPTADAHVATVRRCAQTVGAHATLIRAPEQIRRSIDVFQPQQPGVAALMQRVKNSFDPKNILNRGRLTRETAA